MRKFIVVTTIHSQSTGVTGFAEFPFVRQMPCAKQIARFLRQRLPSPAAQPQHGGSENR